MAVDGTRVHPRYAIDAAVELRHADSAAAVGTTTNISRGGLCVDLDRALATGLAVQIAITLVFDDRRQSEALELPARVMWSTQLGESYQVGCQFVGLRPRDVAYLDMFLRYLAGSPPAEATSPDTDDDPFR